MALPNTTNPSKTPWEIINEVLGSKAVETGLGVIGSGLKSKAEGDRFDAQMGQNANQFRANLQAGQLRDQQALRAQRAAQALSSTKLGENENYTTRNRIARALMPAMANAPKLMPGDPAVAAVMPTGGLDLNGLITPAMMQALSDPATAAAIAQRSKMLTNVDPTAAMPDLQAMGLDPQGEQSSMMERYQQSRLAEETDQDSRIQQLIDQALDEDYLGEKQKGQAPEGYEYDKKTGELKKKGGGFLGGLGKVLGFGAQIALPFLTGGMSIPAQIGLNAAVGAGSGLLQGGGAKGALTGAATGALTGAVSGAAQGPRTLTAANAAQAAKDEALRKASRIPGRT